MKNDGVGGDWKGDGEGNVLVTVVRDTAQQQQQEIPAELFFCVGPNGQTQTARLPFKPFKRLTVTNLAV